MTIKRTIECDACKTKQVETGQDTGFPNWGAIHGVALNGLVNPTLCPACLNSVMKHLDSIIAMKGV